MDLSDGPIADLIVPRLIGEGYPPGIEGNCASLAIRPGALVFAPVACARNGTSVTPLTEVVMSPWNQTSGTGSSYRRSSFSSGG
jgi:hypothetical protein